MTENDISSLDELVKNKELVILHADKGGAVVVMDWNCYDNEAHRQLGDARYYNKMPLDPTPVFSAQIRDFLDSAVDNGIITSQTLKHLTITDPARQSIYFLPKIHKDLLHPPGRPIVSDLQKSKQLEQANLLLNSSVYLETQFAQAEMKAANLSRDRTYLQMQLKQAEMTINDLTQKQSDLQVQLQTAQQDITQLNSKLQGKCCPVGWESLSPNCYYFATSSENWFNAQTRCKDLSSDLVVIKGAEEQEFIKNRKKRGWAYWIGLTDTEVENTWKWVDGSLCSSSSDGTV
ncbi:CD209 antigen-like [Protopterus annectens]|uniref:CD209 antigen-like n=1 Tax=Protopterus annectens TaxID=7888 RepID=UPI001CFB3A6C|nr:CD209 antigen-like [Protopterus annectens]